MKFLKAFLLSLAALVLFAPAARCQSEPAAIPSMTPEFAVDAAWGAAAATDVALSQECIQAQRCREANPLLPSQPAAMFAVEAAETAAGMWAFHQLLKRGSDLAWLVPASNLTLHGLGIWSYTR